MRQRLFKQPNPASSIEELYKESEELRWSLFKLVAAFEVKYGVDVTIFERKTRDGDPPHENECCEHYINEDEDYVPILPIEIKVSLADY